MAVGGVATVESGDANGTTVKIRRDYGGAWLMVNDPANLDYVEVWLDAEQAAEVAAALVNPLTEESNA